MKTKNNHYKKIPNYWWDFGENNTIIVESDHPKFPVVAAFSYDPEGGEEARGIVREFCLQKDLGTKCGAAHHAIENAQKYIEDLKAGRITPTKVNYERS
jgi:hypothetical protein